LGKEKGGRDKYFHGDQNPDVVRQVLSDLGPVEWAKLCERGVKGGGVSSGARVQRGTVVVQDHSRTLGVLACARCDDNSLVSRRVKQGSVLLVVAVAIVVEEGMS